jgi:hypothetical protein
MRAGRATSGQWQPPLRREAGEQFGAQERSLRFHARPRREQEHRHGRPVVVRIRLLKQAEVPVKQLQRLQLVPEPELR